MRNGLAMQAAEDILSAAGPTALDRILDSTEGLTSTVITGALFRRAADPTRPKLARAADYRRVIPMLLRDGEVERARDALDFLEEAAFDGIDCSDFLQLLDESSRYDPAWGSDRVLEAQVYLLESDGRFSEAAVLLERACYRMLARDDDRGLDEALLALAKLQGYGPSAQEIVAWSGNWSSYADEFSRLLRRNDGVVFLSLMRTMLGRTMRERCHLPWRGCGRGGQGAILQQKILEVVPYTQARRRGGADIGQQS